MKIYYATRKDARQAVAKKREARKIRDEGYYAPTGRRWAVQLGR